MERGESILDAIFDEDDVEDVQGVEMIEVEEGELVGQDSQTELGQNIGEDVHAVNQETDNKNWKHRNKKKKKSRRKKGSSGPNVTDINRFVLDVCKHLNEKKMYLVYTAVGCLGVSALSELVKEVDAIQACGGQKTSDGRRFRDGGGILWSVLKIRDPNAFKEIMKKGKEFEKQFRQQNIRQGSVSHVQNQPEQSNVEGKHVSVHDRIRVPVTYDDLLGEEDPKDKSA